MLIRKLMHAKHGQFSNEANWVYHNEYLALPKERRDRFSYQDFLIRKLHPDYGTPNWCPTCSPKGLGYCQCEIASNE